MGRVIQLFVFFALIVIDGTSVPSMKNFKLQFILHQPNNDHCKCEDKCEATWTQNSGFCYKHFDDKKTYDEAKQACAHEHAFLVEVENDEEMSFLTFLVSGKATNQLDDSRNRFWLGITDKAKEGSWIRDRTGVKTTYLNWGAGEPSGYSDDADCAIAGDLLPDDWVNVNCKRHYKFVCKRKS